MNNDIYENEEGVVNFAREGYLRRSVRIAQQRERERKRNQQGEGSSRNNSNC